MGPLNSKVLILATLLAAASSGESCIPLGDEVDAGVQFLQSNVRSQPSTQRSKSKPWDHHLYLVGTRHKAGSQMLRNIMRRAFDSLGANISCKEHKAGSIITTHGNTHEAFGKTVKNVCEFMSYVPIHWNNGLSALDLQVDRRWAGKNGMRAVHIIRDPLQMVSSAYCYHHSGQEKGSTNAPPNIMELSPREGVPATAKTMLGTVRTMVGAFNVSDTKDTYVAKYEELTHSSESFDKVVAEMMDFLFYDLISAEEKQTLLINARSEDLHRGEHGYSAGTGHVSDDACKKEADAALELIDADLLSEYQFHQATLGYKHVTS
eukprot:TRINITY_DN8321_c0_g1_i1.p1 TRINITY_DN8321_c0_g1~~TRINITY_DN8321_c0_g1_i1.p1  ORF type:complete len:320 (-),score=38.92 TRINITY_DN8321_c0_g1_i1:64-1023(-)